MAFTLKTIKWTVALQAIFGYHVGVVAAGLIIHPYQTVQDVVRHGIPGSAILLPTFCWLLAMLMLKTIEHFLFALVPYLGSWWFLFIWGTIFLTLWQILLLYLFWRFTKILSANSRVI